ncbi:MAG: AI-2E family transporter [Chitinophagaceae bacterium]
MEQFNNRIRQVFVLIIIILMGYLIAKELYIFLPGLLGAITLYILSRGQYFHLVHGKKWNASLTAFIFMLGYLILIGIPFFLSFRMIAPKVSDLVSNSDEFLRGIDALALKIKKIMGIDLLSKEYIQKLQGNAGDFIPTFLNSSLNILGNIIMAFFVLYFMLVHGREMEATIIQFIPLHVENIDKLAHETKTMVRANAIGIPLISIIQGVTATIGYWIFGLQEWGLWGFLTGVFAFFPIIGTMIIWVPLVVLQFSTGDTWNGMGLLLYSLFITGNIDYVARITLMRKIGDVHPLVTILGVIVGLGLFGFMGFIFGPLLLSYVILLMRIYSKEFTEQQQSQQKSHH